MELHLNEDRRKHPRAGRMGLVVRLEGQTFEVTNWSMGGFLLEDYKGPLTPGALVTVAGIGCRKTDMHEVDLPARVVRTDDGVIAVNYLGLDAKAYDFLTDALNQCGEMRNLV